ncbi:MAG: NADH-quinone oxidoreductase subunit M [Acidobacteriota bacterium]|nr:NADH-quinone oxidoreductase subunit M [Blastocatellia bacterium]MDW8412759.1 NADH-quinone oxidoreductase subunit M [Acidobacteriota bacterium]
MHFIKQNILTVVTFLPLFGALLMLLHSYFRGNNPEAMRRMALGFSLATFLASLPLIGWYADPTLIVKANWIGSLGVSYHLRVDGLSLWLVILTTLLVPLCVLASWHIDKHVREYMVFMLMLETGMVGVFLAMDMFLFYLFWEVMLVPMYFLIGVWGGERRIYAAIKFVIYTMIGSLLMLVAIIALYLLHGQSTGVYTFDIVQITENIARYDFLTYQQQMWMFAAFALAFMIKVPLFPLHTWLPDAHVEAPTAGSVILAGVLLKMGTYGLMRFNLPMFPEAAHRFAIPIMILAVIGIVYGALVAMVQPDLKKLVAYSSVSHLGFVVLGTFAFTETGMQGALYQMLNHGISTGALFLLVGVIYERRHTRLISEFGGLSTPMPVYATIFMIVTLSSIGLPLLNGFVGEFLILVGTFTSAHPRILAVIATSGVVLSAVYMLWMTQRVLFGRVTNEHNKSLADVTLREKLTLVPLVVLIIFMGVYPSFFLKRSAGQLQQIHRLVNERAVAGMVR